MTSILKVTEIQDPTNSNSALTIDSSGQVTLPKIPFAMVNVSGSNNMTPGSSGTIPFNNVLSSRGISWNTSTYKFTVPVAGLYNFSGAVRLNGDRTYLFWVVDSPVGTAVQASKIVLGQGYSGTGFTTACGSCMLSLSTGTDYVIRASDSSQSSVAVEPAQTFMDVRLIG